MSDDTTTEAAPQVDEGIPGGLQRGRYRTASNLKSTGKKPYDRFSAAGQGLDVYSAGPSQPDEVDEPDDSADDDEVETKIVTAPAPKPKKPAKTAETK